MISSFIKAVDNAPGSPDRAMDDDEQLHAMQARLHVLENLNTELQSRKQELYEQIASHRVALAEMKGRSSELMNMIDEQRSVSSVN